MRLRHIIWLTAIALLTKPVAANLITFDEFGPTNATVTPIPNGYAGLDWLNFNVKSAGQTIDPQHDTGYGHGVVSPFDITYNSAGNPATIFSSLRAPFTLISVYLTAAWNDDLNVTIEATGAGGKHAAEFAQTVTINTLAPTLVTLNFPNIHIVTFSSSGGTAHTPDVFGTQFVMDDLTLASLPSAPEPATAATLLSALFLIPRRRNTP
jgi:hypothetical protein